MTHIQAHSLVTDETLRNRVTMAIVALAATARANPETPAVVKQFANHCWTAADASRHVDKVLTGLALLDETIRTAYATDPETVTDAMLDAGNVLKVGALVGIGQGLVLGIASAVGEVQRVFSEVKEAIDLGGTNFQQHLFGGGATSNGRYGGVQASDQDGAGNLTVNGPTNIGNGNYASIFSQTLPAGTFRMWTTQRENNSPANANTQGNKLIRDTTVLATGSNAVPVGYEAIPYASEVLVIGNGRGNTSLAPVGEISFVAVIADWTVSPAAWRALLQSTILADQLP